MTVAEVNKIIEPIPLGAKLQVIKTNGSIVDVVLMSHEVAGTLSKNYGNLEVPSLPPAIIVSGGTRFGNFRIDAKDIVNIAWIK